MGNTENDENSLEAMLARGEILEIGEVKIEEEEELKIPVHVAEDESIVQDYPVLVIYTAKAENKQQPAAQEPKAAPLFTHVLKIEDAQKRLRNLADYLLPEPGKAHRIAKAFGMTTERDRISAFGNYFADFLANKDYALGNEGYVNPAQFIVKAEIALMNLKSGKEGGKPIRKTIRKALSGKNEEVYDSIRQKLPEIARAVATTGTGFALEMCSIYSDADRASKSAFEYAKDIRRERQLDELARQANYGLYR